jgi:DNA uptake protein ComE-like DNA-binding protein
MAKYQVHTAYISSRIGIIQAGIYDEKELDMVEANQRSKVTLYSPDGVAPAIIETTTVPTELYSDVLGTKENFVELKPTVTLVEVKTIAINTISEKDLIKLPHIGKGIATKVMAARPFTSLKQLNDKVPLPRNRKWEDLFVIEIPVVETIDKNSLRFTVT